MKESPKQDMPYKNLGARLRDVRRKSSQTIEEVSGAVEIDEQILSKIEAGQLRPSEELLELLSSHYKLSDDEVIKLLDLAGYIQEESKTNYSDIGDSALTRTVIMMLSQDKVMYTDGLDVHYDPTGLMLNFKQSAGQPKPLSVAKLGMSYAQAEEVLKTLSKVLIQAKNLKNPKPLPGTKSKKS